MLEKKDTIYLYRGATSSVEFDFTEFDFEDGSKCEFTMTGACDDKVYKKVEFTESKKYILTFTDDFTKNLEGSRYKYNIMYFVGDERYPQCANSDIVVDGVINSYEGN